MSAGYLTVVEFAARYRRSLSQISREIKAGRLKASRIGRETFIIERHALVWAGRQMETENGR